MLCHKTGTVRSLQATEKKEEEEEVKSGRRKTIQNRGVIEENDSEQQ